MLRPYGMSAWAVKMYWKISKKTMQNSDALFINKNTLQDTFSPESMLIKFDLLWRVKASLINEAFYPHHFQFSTLLLMSFV